MSSTRRVALVAVLALLGIVLAAAITWGTSQLVRQRIGLASEPLNAGQRLLPPSLTSRSTTTVTAPRRLTTTVTTTAPAVPTPVPTPAPAPAPTPTSAAPSVAPSQPATPSRGGSDKADSAGRDD